MTEAAFKASYSDWKVIKGRKVVQVIFELPIETADQAYQVLGGMPNMASEIWCGIARLEKSVSRQPIPPVAENKPGPATPGKSVPVRADKERRQFGELKPSTQAGIICGERAFRLFLAEKFPEVWTITNRDPAACVREICKVDSRADIKPDNADWSALVLAYRLWMNHPEYAQ